MTPAEKATSLAESKITSEDRKLWYIKRADLFSRLGREDLAHLARISTMVECRRGQMLYLPDDPSDRVYLVKKGEFKLLRQSAEGQEMILEILGPGEIFGELSLGGEDTRTHYAEAGRESLICIFRREDFEEFLARHGELALRVVKLMGMKRRVLESRLEDLAFHPVSVRLRLTLLRLAERYGSAGHNDAEVRLPLTQKDLAHLIGASRETVTEQLNILKRQGLIETGYRSLILTELGKLRDSLGEL